MKRPILNFLSFHIFPIFIVFFITIIVLKYFKNNIADNKIKTTEIIGKQEMYKGYYSNCANSTQEEIELAGSLQNKNFITFLASSELSNNSPYIPYNFLPDSLNMPLLAFGHAHHQSFSIYCELLAMQKYLKGSKISIFLSPGWFESEGTNIEAFLEFVRPNFLKSIVYNKKINFSDKIEIKKFISSNIDNIENPSEEIKYFYDLNENIKQIRDFQEILYRTKNSTVNYSVKLLKSKPKNNNYKWFNFKERLQQDFIDSTSTNSYYILNSYYKTYLLDKNGKYQHGITLKMDTKTNQELKDFKLLVKFLKQNQCKASFIMQALNPYHYNNLKEFNPVMKEIKNTIESNNFPYLNMFVTEGKQFEPGILHDIMHTNDYGWMKINKFLYDTYKE
jgi:poly-D-alanine transfer protein DltD